MRTSIIIPCHNAGPYLEPAIRSALEQTRPPDEVIIVDDASTDGSTEVARRAVDRHPKGVRLVEAHARNASRARNLGARLATGDALMFLDADDLLGPTALEALTAALERQSFGFAQDRSSGFAQNRLSGFAACPWFRLVCDAGHWSVQPPSCAPRRQGQDALSGWLTGWYYPPCAVLWSRDGFERAGRWDELAIVNDDGDLAMRALAWDIPLEETTAGAAYYRRHPSGRASKSGSRATQAGLESRRRTIEKVAAILQHRGQLAPYRRALADGLGLLAPDTGRPAAAARAAVIGRSDTRSLSGTRPAPAHSVEGSPPRTRSVHPRVRGPAVTVVVPAFNRADVLPRAVRSVLGQSFEDFELLVVDDASTDDTHAVVASLTDPRVRYLRQPHNRGVAAARNRGMREARGDFIAFLDSDDEWTPTKLEAQMEVLSSSPAAVGLVYSGVETRDAQGNVSMQRPGARGDIYREMLWRNVIHGGGSNVVLRRDVVATAGFFHEELPAVEDYDYWLRVTRFFDVDFVDAPLVRYYDPPQATRRSRAVAANLDARWWLYRTYAEEMRAAGVAHLFLLHTVRWALAYAGADPRLVRRFLVHAVREKPASRMTIAMAAQALLPASGRFKWVQRHAML